MHTKLLKPSSSEKSLEPSQPQVDKDENSQASASRKLCPKYLQGKLESQKIDDATIQRQSLEEKEEELIQPKLAISTADDMYEREADRIADHVIDKSDCENESDNKNNVGRKSQTPLYLQRLHSKSGFDSFQSPVIQNKESNNTAKDTHENITTTIQNPSGGSVIPEPIKNRIEPVLNIDLGHVKVHQSESADQATKSLNARAFTNKNNIWLAKNESANNLHLMAHEATHVFQQQSFGEIDEQSKIQREVLDAGVEEPRDASLPGGVPLPTPAPPPPPIVCPAQPATSLSDLIAQWRQAQGAAQEALRTQIINQIVCRLQSLTDKGQIFDLLRSLPTTLNLSSSIVLTRFQEFVPSFVSGSDDIWLAESIIIHGPEPLWPDALISERHLRATSGGWAPEAGNIEATLEYPDLTAAEMALDLPPIHAYFFPGQTNRRALVIGGVHGTEPQGSEAVERLRESLATSSEQGSPPFFTTILIPVLIPRTTPRGSGSVTRYGRGSRYVNGVEPNRNFPMPGDTYADARRRGRTRADSAELVFTDDQGTVRPPQNNAVSSHASQQMLPETRALITLIERFQPERVASIHAHSVSSARGDAPGIFVDPRGGFNTATDTPSTAEGLEDDALATRMLTEAQRLNRANPGARADAFSGNTSTTWPGSITAPYTASRGSPTVHYTSTVHGEGNSLGMWAPAAGISTVTVEIPQWGRQSSRMDSLLNVHSDVLQNVFLADPGATP